jgi:hypothetical protein
MRNLDRLGVGVRETIPLHLGEDPVDGPLERGRPAEPVAVAVDEPAEPVVGAAVGERGVDDLVRGIAILRGDGGIRGLGGERAAGAERGEAAN